MISVRLNSLVPLGLIVDSVVDGLTCAVVLASGNAIESMPVVWPRVSAGAQPLP
jgi:hypothetical protein